MKFIHCMLRALIIGLSVFFLLINAVCAKTPVIVDSDMGIDDAIGILYLLQRQDLQVKAITIASNGSAHCQPALRNVLGLLTLARYPYVSIACGQKKPLLGNHHFPASILHESDTLAGTSNILPMIKSRPQQSAVDLIIQTLQKSPTSVTILAIGSLTNIAEALQKAPQIKSKIKTLYITGGAISVPGNLPIVEPSLKNTTAEWNIYIDPLAASIVLRQAIPIVLVPLDVTNQLPIDMLFYNTFKQNHHTPVSDYVFSIMKNNIGMILEKGWYFWDPLAAVVASDESIAEFKTKRLNVILTPETRSGTTAIDRYTGYKVRVVTKVNEAKFKSMLLDYLNQSL